MGINRRTLAKDDVRVHAKTKLKAGARELSVAGLCEWLDSHGYSDFVLSSIEGAVRAAARDDDELVLAEDRYGYEVVRLAASDGTSRNRVAEVRAAVGVEREALAEKLDTTTADVVEIEEAEEVEDEAAVVEAFVGLTDIDDAKKAREGLGLTQGDLAELTGLHRSSVSNYEGGRRAVSASMLTRIWAALLFAEMPEHARHPKAGSIIRALREASGWSQEDLAERTGLTRHTVSLMEVHNNPKGAKWPSYVKLGAAFGVEPQWLKAMYEHELSIFASAA